MKPFCFLLFFFHTARPRMQRGCFCFQQLHINQGMPRTIFDFVFFFRFLFWFLVDYHMHKMYQLGEMMRLFKRIAPKALDIIKLFIVFFSLRICFVCFVFKLHKKQNKKWIHQFQSALTLKKNCNKHTNSKCAAFCVFFRWFFLLWKFLLSWFGLKFIRFVDREKNVYFFI